MSDAMTISPPVATPPHDGLCDEQGPIPVFAREQVDERGRLIPVTPEEDRARADAAVRALEALAKIPDNEGDDERWRDALHDLDARRPHRPLFEGMY